MQAALRGVIEEVSSNCTFILTCNFKARIIEAIHSRCQHVDFAIEREEKPQMAFQLFKRIGRINNAPVYWYSKRQGSVESSTYQAEFTAMKEAAEYVRALRYKLRMMGIPVEGQPLSLEIISRCRCLLVRSAMGL